MKHTPGTWREFCGMVETETGIPIARMDRETNHTTPTERDANARLIAASPIGYEIAEAIIAQGTDGLDRSAWLLKKAKQFMEIAKRGYHAKNG